MRKLIGLAALASVSLAVFPAAAAAQACESPVTAMSLDRQSIRWGETITLQVSTNRTATLDPRIENDVGVLAALHSESKFDAPPGTYTFSWDGWNDAHEPTQTGTYYFALEADTGNCQTTGRLAFGVQAPNEGASGPTPPTHRCRAVLYRYRERVNNRLAPLYVRAKPIAAQRTSCATARRVAYLSARAYRFRGRPPHSVLRFRCAFARFGNDVGHAFCRRGSAWVRFGLYDNSPVH